MTADAGLPLVSAMASSACNEKQQPNIIILINMAGAATLYLSSTLNLAWLKSQDSGFKKESQALRFMNLRYQASARGYLEAKRKGT